MTIDRHYKCDLCHKSLNDTKDNLVGIIWKAGGDIFSATHYYDKHNGSHVEHHLCVDCIKSIKQMKVWINGIEHKFDN